MKDDLGAILINSAEIWRRGYKSIITNAGKAIAAITLLISAFVIFTDVGIVKADLEALSCILVMMLIASYVMYFSMENAGEKLGMESAEYAEAVGRYKSAVCKIRPNMIPKMRDFCKRYTQEEGRYRREAYLAEHGLTLENLDEYKAGKVFCRKDRRALRRAVRIKTARLTPSDLTADGFSHGGELSNPERTRTVSMLIKMLPTAVCTLFTASVVLGAKESLDAPAIIEGLLKLSALAIVGLRGYTAGYFFAKGKLLAWLETKTKLLLAFDAELTEEEKNKIE